MASLCSSCKNAQVMTRGNGTQSILCDSTTTPMFVPGDITRCSAYHHMNQPSRYEFEKIAYAITINANGKLGFIPPTKD